MIHTDDHGDIAFFAVDERYRKGGFGKTCAYAAATYFQQKGKDNMTLDADAKVIDGKTAVGYWGEQIGFNETGEPAKEDGTVPMVGVTSDVLNKLKGKEMPGYAYIIINPQDNPKDRLKQTKEIIHVEIPRHEAEKGAAVVEKDAAVAEQEAAVAEEGAAVAEEDAAGPAQSTSRALAVPNTSTAAAAVGVTDDPISLALCMFILNKALQIIKKFNDIHYFLQPVNVEGYETVITDPIDISTIEARITRGEYTTLQDVITGFDLMFDNCRKYNEVNRNKEGKQFFLTLAERLQPQVNKRLSWVKKHAGLAKADQEAAVAAAVAKAEEKGKAAVAAAVAKAEEKGKAAVAKAVAAAAKVNPTNRQMTAALPRFSHSEMQTMTNDRLIRHIETLRCEIGSLKTQSGLARERRQAELAKSNEELKQKDVEIKRLLQRLADAKTSSSGTLVVTGGASGQDSDSVWNPPDHFRPDGRPKLFMKILDFRTGKKPGTDQFEEQLTDIDNFLVGYPECANIRDRCTGFTPLMLACCYKVLDLSNHGVFSEARGRLRDEIDPELVEVLLKHESVRETIDECLTPVNQTRGEPRAKKSRKSQAAAPAKTEIALHGDALYLSIFGTSPFPAKSGKGGPPYVNSNCMDVVCQLLAAGAIAHAITIQTIEEIAPRKLHTTWEPCDRNLPQQLLSFVQGKIPVPKHIEDHRPHAKDIWVCYQHLRKLQAIQRAMTIFRIQDIEDVPTSKNAVRQLQLPNGRNPDVGKWARDILNEAQDFIKGWQSSQRKRKREHEEDQQRNEQLAGGSAAAAAAASEDSSAAAAATASEDGSAAVANTAPEVFMLTDRPGGATAVKQEPKGKNCEDCGQPWKVILKKPNSDSSPQAKYAKVGRQLYLNREYLQDKPYDAKLLEECKKLRGQTRGERASVLHYDEQEEAGSPEKGTQGPNGNTNPYLCPDCWHKFLSEWRSKSRATGGGEDGAAAAAAGD
eukprot:COSAG02_NODE_2617_length_8409_cov_2.491697_3_plen_975_part_00